MFKNSHKYEIYADHLHFAASQILTSKPYTQLSQIKFSQHTIYIPSVHWITGPKRWIPMCQH